MLRTSAVLFVWRVPAQALLGQSLHVPSHGVCGEFFDELATSSALAAGP
jgi:hypothetical protein